MGDVPPPWAYIGNVRRDMTAAVAVLGATSTETDRRTVRQINRQAGRTQVGKPVSKRVGALTQKETETGRRRRRDGDVGSGGGRRTRRTHEVEHNR